MAKNVQKKSLWDGLEPDEKQADTHTHTHEYEHTHKVKELKTSRIQILTYKSLVSRMDTYAKSRGLSRAEVFEAAVQEYLDNHA